MRLGCDIGGTFTDFVLIDDETGAIRIYKCLTTPGDPSDAVDEGLQPLARGTPGLGGKLGGGIQGKTVGINPILRRKGAPAALASPGGFRGGLGIGREIRY